MTPIDNNMPRNAVSVYNAESSDDFPVLKAFQQYIDAEQNKARKRMLSLCIFFVFLMTAVVVVFLLIINSANLRNQQLNDRMLEFVLKDRDRQTTPVVVNSPSDNSAVLQLAAKLDELQKSISAKEAKEQEELRAERQTKVEQEAAARLLEREAEINRQLEVLKRREQELLSQERERAKAEKERQRQEELEAYRRKHFPELYAPQAKSVQDEESAVDSEIDAIVSSLDDSEAIDYFADEKLQQTPSPLLPEQSRSKWRLPNQ